MRFRKPRIALLLLVSALPYLLADGSSSSSSSSIDGTINHGRVPLDVTDPIPHGIEEEQEPIEPSKADRDVPPSDAVASSWDLDEVDETEKEEQRQPKKIEPRMRPQQQGTGKDDENRLASSRDYEDPQFDKVEEEQPIPEDDYSSTIATDDNAHENDANIDTERKDSVDITMNRSQQDVSEEGGQEIASEAIHEESHRLSALSQLDAIEETSTDDKGEEMRDLLTEVAESASEAVYEDDFRLPALPKLDATDATPPEKEDENHRQAADSSIQETNKNSSEEDDEEIQLSEASDDSEDTDGNQVPERAKASDVIETDDDSSGEEEKKSQHESPSDNDNKDSDNLHAMSDISKSGKEPVIKETKIERDVEDEEVVVLKNAKLAIGTTSVESIDGDNDEEDGGDNMDVDVDNNINDEAQVIDAELPEAIEEENESPDNVGDSSAAKPEVEESVEIPREDDTNDISDEDTGDDKTIDDGDVVDSKIVDDNTPLDDAEVKNLTDKEITGSNTSAAEVIPDDGRDIAKTEEEKILEEELKLEDDDEDDEDLAERVSVDYASKSAGALIIEKTAEFKGTSNLITGDRDKYAIVPCGEEKKQIVMSLSEDILVKEIKLANYERFSSTVKDFQVKGSHTLGKWVDLGTYRAEPGNGEQTFPMKTPSWARYLRFRFLTHHGVEYYCTLSQIKVHGSNMVQGFHEEWGRIEEENNEEQSEAEKPEDATERSIADDSEKTDVDTNTEDSAKEENAGENLSNSSVAHEEVLDSSASSVDIDAAEKGDSAPRNAQATPSVHFKQIPLDQFRSPTNFYEIIQGEIDDEKLFSDLYNLIPHTLGNLPAHAKNDLLVCRAEDHEIRSVHQIGRLAMESLYSIGSRIVDDIGLMVSDGTDSSTISSPRMNEFSNEYYEMYFAERFGSGLSEMISLNANNVIAPNKIEPPLNVITDGRITESDEASSAQQSNETDQDKSAKVSETGDKSSSTPSKKEELPPQEASGFVNKSDESLDLTVLKLLKDLPSAECLVNLDFGEFKSNVSAARKSTSASGGSQAGRMVEPIFKKLTDEIFALQTSLSVHDQFAKMSMGCYQRVILDLAVETERLRKDQDERLRKLEEQILEPASFQMFRKLVVSLVTTTTTWLISNASYLFVTAKDVWIPRIIVLYLSSKDSYEGFHNTMETLLEYLSPASNAFHTILNQTSKAIETLRIALESKEWTQLASYQELRSAWSASYETSQKFLSEWSSYYDGGMTMVWLVLTLIVCRMIMMCSSFRRRNQKMARSPRKEPPGRVEPPGRNPARSPSTADLEYSGLSRSTSKKRKKKSKRGKPHYRSEHTNVVPAVGDTTSLNPPEESIPKPNGDIPAKPSEESIQEPGDKPLESSSKKSTHKSTSVPVVEDTQHSGESIPELEDESLQGSNNMPNNGRDSRPAAMSPSVVSLEDG